jgi:hypothetical protein
MKRNYIVITLLLGGILSHQIAEGLLAKDISQFGVTRGPRGKQGRKGATGDSGPNGSTIFPSVPGTLTVTYTPIQYTDGDNIGTWEALLIAPDGTVVAQSQVYDITQSYPQQTLTATSLQAGTYAFIQHNINAINTHSLPVFPAPPPPYPNSGSPGLIESSGNPGPVRFTYSIAGQDLQYDDYTIVTPPPGSTKSLFYTLYKQ